MSSASMVGECRVAPIGSSAKPRRAVGDGWIAFFEPQLEPRCHVVAVPRCGHRNVSPPSRDPTNPAGFEHYRHDQAHVTL